MLWNLPVSQPRNIKFSQVFLDQGGTVEKSSRMPIISEIGEGTHIYTSMGMITNKGKI